MTDLSRRSLLSMLALALPVGVGAQSGPASRIYVSDPPKPIPPKPGTKPVITSAQLKFLGFYRFGTDSGAISNSYTSLAMRKVGNETRLFHLGDWSQTDPLIEVRVTSEPNLNINAAPLLPAHKIWGPVTVGRRITGGQQSVPGGLYWDASRNGIWWSYGDIYVPVQHHPTIGFTALNDAASTWTSYGPWRCAWHPQRTRGAMTQIPASFANAYAGGQQCAVQGHMASGVAACPFGASLSALSLPPPTTTPPDTASSTHVTIANKGVILHDIDHKQTRDANYATCGWNVANGACSQGFYIQPGIPTWGGTNPAVGENDTMCSSVWVDLPDKHGLLYFGQLVTTPAGYKAPGDPNGFVHMWYGNPWPNDSHPPKNCCHLQEDPWWGATGPGCHFRVPMMWIYNPDDLVASTSGTASLWSRVPTSTFQAQSIAPQIFSRYGSPVWGTGACFDSASRRVYAIVSRHDYVTVPNQGRPAVVVFQVL